MTHHLLTTIVQAYQQNRLVVLWGAVPFSLHPTQPPNRVLALNQWRQTPVSVPAISQAVLPPLPILSLDPTNRLERQFQEAGQPLTVVRTRRDVLATGHHNLLKLGGDLQTRSGVLLSHAEIRDLPNDPDKAHQLAEVRRTLDSDGVLLVLAESPADDFRTWWSVVGPGLGHPQAYGLGDTILWPDDITPLALDFEELVAALNQVVTETPPPQIRYHLANIRTLLTEGFSDEDLRRLCFDNPPFQPVYDELAAATGKAAIIDALLAYARRKLLLAQLLTLLQESNPVRYEQHSPYTH